LKQVTIPEYVKYMVPATGNKNSMNWRAGKKSRNLKAKKIVIKAHACTSLQSAHRQPILYQHDKMTPPQFILQK
jgi:hypothetical protein